MRFEWHPEKAVANVATHGISIEEVSSVFGDPLATTLSDPEHSAGEKRFVTTGMSSQQRVASFDAPTPATRFESSGRAGRRPGSGGAMSQVNEPAADEMRPEYDLRGGVRGKYYGRYQLGMNVVLLAPDVASVFQDSESVNRALRMLIDVARGQVGGRSDRRHHVASPHSMPSPSAHGGGGGQADGALPLRRPEPHLLYARDQSPQWNTLIPKQLDPDRLPPQPPPMPREARLNALPIWIRSAFVMGGPGQVRQVTMRGVMVLWYRSN
jgi:hypothetical protein